MAEKKWRKVVKAANDNVNDHAYIHSLLASPSQELHDLETAVVCLETFSYRQ